MLKDNIAIFKDTFAGIREALLVILLLIVAFNFPVVSRWLDRNGIDGLNIMGVSLKQKEKAAIDSVAAGDSLAKLTNDANATKDQLAALNETIKQLQAVASPSAAPALAKLEVQAAKAFKSIGQTVAAADTAAQRNAQVIAVQSRGLEKAGSKAVEQSGWAMAGRVDPTQTRWQWKNPYVTAPAPGAIDGQATWTIAASLRSLQPPVDSPNRYSRRSVVGALAAGETFKVLEKGYVPLPRSGDYTLWLKVERR